MVLEAVGLAAVAGGSAYFSANTGVDFLANLSDSLKKSQVYVAAKGCDAGGDGCWMVLEGGPKYLGGDKWEPHDFTLTEKSRTWVWERGTFTAISYDKYYTASDLPAAPSNKIGQTFTIVGQNRTVYPSQLFIKDSDFHQASSIFVLKKMTRDEDKKSFYVICLTRRSTGQEHEFGSLDEDLFKKSLSSILPNQLAFNADDNNKVTKYAHFNWRLFNYKGKEYKCLTVEDLGLSQTEKAAIDEEMKNDALTKLKY